MKIKVTTGLLIIFAAYIFAGCAGQSKELLGENYQSMSDDKLLEYFYRLNDEIEKQEKQTGPSFGVGIGGFGHSRGAVGGVGVGTGGTAYTAEDLRQRRIEVRMEMKKRNINP
ncbi:MAG: hypothetical protein CVU72_05640 [Deltaproteobacteria bacterium HGW-Deltaproteobacteria-7]|nr:MAG: hypothetical protein CVU72_05640 [Deltaproteobacteria bacterium HGW-Deltaproteobacteria-7]PKN18205.1 MAG: hypothetical protein CVU71_11880 [Deltaproteobacteria bacterium HGW-Deltaproteobacteria-6]